MTQLTLNLLKDTEASGERMTSSLPEASLNHVNPTQPQENALEKKMRDTSGRRCLESYGKFSRHGSWAKTFSALLIGMGDWYSKRCRLTWKLKGTKSNRMYFQLVPSTHRTEGTGFGLLQGEYKGLYPTVAAQDATGIKNLRKDATVSDVGFHSMSLTHFATIGLLPTPTASIADRGTERQLQVIDGQIQNISQKGTKFGINIRQLAEQGFLPTPKVGGKEGYETRAKRQGHEKAISHLEAFVEYHTKMLPTPATLDYKGARTTESLEMAGRNHTNSLPDSFAKPGTTSQLSPLFTLEMMGFPVTHTQKPFQKNIEWIEI